MDEELKKLLDDARARGFSIQQLQGVVDKYKSVKAQQPKGVKAEVESGGLKSARFKIMQENKAEINTIIKQTVKLNSLKIEEAKNKIIRNEIVNYSFLVIVALVSVFMLIKIFRTIKLFVSSFNFSRFKPKLNNSEVYIISFSLGAITSLSVGNFYPTYNYYMLKGGNAIKVSEKLADYYIENFNFPLAIITFLLVSLIFYFIFRIKKTYLTN